RHYLIDHTQLEQIRCRDSQRRCCFLTHLRTLSILPQNSSAAFDRDHRVHSVFQHQNAIGNSEGQRSTRSTLANDRGDNWDSQLAHLEKIARDRLRLPALFSANSRPCPHSIDESDHRDMEFFRELHEPQRFSVTLMMRHAEVALEELLGVAPALMADDHHRFSIESRPAGNDRRVIAECAITMQLYEICENQIDQL